MCKTSEKMRCLLQNNDVSYAMVTNILLLTGAVHTPAPSPHHLSTVTEVAANLKCKQLTKMITRAIKYSKYVRT